MGTSSNFGNMFSAAAASAVLTFLPMLPGQILLNNLLYDSQPARHPHRPGRRGTAAGARRTGTSRSSAGSCSVFGPISSLFDFLTFGVMLWRVPRRPGPVPHRLVRRIPGHPDPGHLRDPHPARALLAQQPSAGPDLAAFAWSPSASACPSHRWRTPSASPPLPWRSSPRWRLARYLVLVELAKKLFYAEPMRRSASRSAPAVGHRIHRRAARFSHGGKISVIRATDFPRS